MAKVFIATVDDPELLGIYDTLAEAKFECGENFDADIGTPDFKIYEGELVTSSAEAGLIWKGEKPKTKQGGSK